MARGCLRATWERTTAPQRRLSAAAGGTRNGGWLRVHGRASGGTRQTDACARSLRGHASATGSEEPWAERDRHHRVRSCGGAARLARGGGPSARGATALRRGAGACRRTAPGGHPPFNTPLAPPPCDPTFWSHGSRRFAVERQHRVHVGVVLQPQSPRGAADACRCRGRRNSNASLRVLSLGPATFPPKRPAGEVLWL